MVSFCGSLTGGWQPWALAKRRLRINELTVLTTKYRAKHATATFVNVKLNILLAPKRLLTVRENARILVAELRRAAESQADLINITITVSVVDATPV